MTHDKKPPPYIQKIERVEPGNRAAIETLAQNIDKNMTAGEGRLDDAQALDSCRNALRRLDARASAVRADIPVTRHFANNAARHRIILPSGALYAESLPQNTAARKDPRVHADLILSQCAGDQTQALRLSNLLSAAPAAHAFLLLTEPADKTDKPLLHLPADDQSRKLFRGRHKESCRFDLSRQTNGDINLRLRAHYPLAGLEPASPKQDAVGLDPKKSSLNIDFAFLIPKNPKQPIEINADGIHYAYALSLRNE